MKNKMCFLAATALVSGVGTGVGLILGAGTATAAEGTGSFLQNRSIGYVMTSELKAIYDTPDGKMECPNGINDGPREQFKILFPEIPGKKYTLQETQLEREGEIWFPSTSPDKVPYHESQSKIAFGLNLDGKIGANDYTSPEGEKGIDNNLQRAWGCTANYRSNSYNLFAFDNWRKYAYNIVVLELTDVDSLVNDDDVTVTSYRGLDKPMTDATGAKYLPGGTQRLDMRWGKQFISKFKGKIKDGVLTTEGADYIMPSAGNGSSFADIRYYKTQWRLTVMPERAEGLMAGYIDIQDWNSASNQQRSTHHQAYGQSATPSSYRLMMKNADYKDPKSGDDAISMALRVKFTQVFVKHPEGNVAAIDTGTAPNKTAGDRD
ncbi:MAG: hypothetical protein K1X51_13950 [Rhodospirillaceae bacterium]|nr:hypothetical protein [Rhodospirillaceae bacterium]